MDYCVARQTKISFFLFASLSAYHELLFQQNVLRFLIIINVNSFFQFPKITFTSVFLVFLFF